MNTAVDHPPAGAKDPQRRRSAWDVQREVLFALIIREASARVGGQWVGAIWTLIEPLAHTMILVTLYSMVLKQDSPGREYPVFYVTGMIPFMLYQSLSNRLMDGLESNRGLFAYRQVKPIDVLLARAVVEAGMTLIVYAFCMSILAWLDFHVVPADPLAVIAVNAILLAFGTGYGVLTSVLTHERPRLRSMFRMLAMPLYLASGVMFPIDTLPKSLLDPLLWNPLLHLVELSRHAFIAAYIPADGIHLLYPLQFSLAVLTAGLALYWSKRHQLIAS